MIRAVIETTVTNGPWSYTVSLNGATQTVVTSVANLSAALDGVKAAVGALGGTPSRVVIVVT